MQQVISRLQQDFEVSTQPCARLLNGCFMLVLKSPNKYFRNKTVLITKNIKYLSNICNKHSKCNSFRVISHLFRVAKMARTL